MLPAVAMGLAQGAIGGIQALFGASQLKKAKKAADAAIAGIETKEVDPLVAARYNAPMPGETEAEQGIGQSETAALGAAKTRKGGLASVSGIVAQTNKARSGLATQKAQYKLGAEKALVGERNAAFQSRQQKQQLQANIALQDVAAQRSMVSQGLSGLAGGLANTGYAMFGAGKNLSKTKTPAITAPTSYNEDTTENTWG